VLERKLATDKLTRQQLQRQDLELKKAARRKEALQTAQADLETQIREINIDQDSINKAAIKARLQREDVLVRTNVLRVQIAKKLVQLNAKADEVMSMENRKEQLRLSMQERMDEVDVHLATLRVQQNKEEEARHRMQVELSDRKHRLDGLTANYYAEMARHQHSPDSVLQAHSVVNFQQERDQLSRRGDELEGEIRTAIQELRGLERSMETMNHDNASFRAGFETIGEDDREFDRKTAAEEEHSMALHRLNSRRADAQSATEERIAMERTFEQQQQDIERNQADVWRLKSGIDELSAENADLKERLKRATLTCTSSTRSASEECQSRTQCTISSITP
jgi:chromosome segregation ATPase